MAEADDLGATGLTGPTGARHAGEILGGDTCGRFFLPFSAPSASLVALRLSWLFGLSIHGAVMDEGSQV